MITDNISVFPDDFEEISQSEYRRLKRDDSKNANGFTARIGFKYYKLKKSTKIIENCLTSLKAEIYRDGWAVLEQEGRCFSLGIYPNASFDILKRLLAEVELDKLKNENENTYN